MLREYGGEGMGGDLSHLPKAWSDASEMDLSAIASHILKCESVFSRIPRRMQACMREERPSRSNLEYGKSRIEIIRWVELHSYEEERYSNKYATEIPRCAGVMVSEYRNFIESHLWIVKKVTASELPHPLHYSHMIIHLAPLRSYPKERVSMNPELFSTLVEQSLFFLQSNFQLNL
jgi:hypothetical protein